MSRILFTESSVSFRSAHILVHEVFHAYVWIDFVLLEFDNRLEVAFSGATWKISLDSSKAPGLIRHRFGEVSATESSSARLSPLVLVNEKLIKVPANGPRNSVGLNREHFVADPTEDTDREIGRANAEIHSLAHVRFQLVLKPTYRLKVGILESNDVIE